jgi:pimeloyl-ACP methyl ester carboxylesterase
MREAVVGPGGARMRWVELAGDEPARVYVHGLGSSSAAYFAEVAADPAVPAKRSLLVDLLGFGFSDRPAGFGYTLEEHADALATALDLAGVRAAAVIGHSMGGSVAIVLAARRPDLVRSLVVVEPNLDPLSPEPGQLGSRGIAHYSEPEFLDHGYEETLALSGDTWRATMRLADPLALHRSAVGLVRGTVPTIRELLVRLDIPRTYVDGGLSTPVPREDELVASGVRYVVVPRAGHNVMIDNPGGFVEAVAPALTAEPSH